MVYVEFIAFIYLRQIAQYSIFEVDKHEKDLNLFCEI